MTKNSRKKFVSFSKISLLSLSLLIGIVVLLYIFLSYNPSNLLYAYLENRTNWFIFAVLMAFLPITGAPISIFLVLVGMIYGITGGIILTGILMLFHLLATYYLVHSFFKPQVVRLLGRFNLKIPRIPGRGAKRLSFIFMLLPGPPYSVKNYLLALAGLPLKPYVLISWPTQFITSLPFIILGKGVAALDVRILAAAAFIILLGILGQYFLQRHFNLSDTG